MKNEMIKSKEHLSIPRLQTLITSMIKQSDNRMNEIENEIGMTEKQLERELEQKVGDEKLSNLIDLNFHFGKWIGLSELNDLLYRLNN